MTTLSSNSKKVLEARYLRHNSKGQIDETPEKLFSRVASTVAKAEYQYGGKPSVDYWSAVFYQMMSELHFLPNTPTLMNAGLINGQLSACFVLPIEDSISSIFDSLELAARIQKSGGGTGFNFSKLRPQGSLVVDSSFAASGPLGFIKLFDAMTNQIKQSGKRRGANMAILNVDHPDIEQFIRSKNKEGELSNFNLSVGVMDEFVKAVLKNEKWQLRHTIATSNKQVSAKKLWKNIIHNAWQTGDPGLIFLDAIDKANPTPQLGHITATNPCGEMPLLDYESCNLGSINLSRMLSLKSDKHKVEWDLLKTTVVHAVRFLDDVIDVNVYPDKRLERMARGNRKIGLGVMGWAEMLIQLQIPYASDQAVALGNKIMSFIDDESKNASEQLANEKSPFPNWKKSRYNAYRKLRNATTTSVAPTGSISIIANTSSSIEPLYALAYERHILEGQSLIELNEIAMQHLKEYKNGTNGLKEIMMKKGSIAGVRQLPKRLKELFKVANEIPFRYHLLHQQAFQNRTDNAVSKTINLDNSTKPTQVGNIYMEAWKMGLKGITIYRDGSKRRQVLQNPKDKVAIHTKHDRCKLCGLD